MSQKPSDIVAQHKDWLGLIEADGPFLSIPVLKRVWPNGIDRLGSSDSRILNLKQLHKKWRQDQTSLKQQWILQVLQDTCEWGQNFVFGPNLPDRLHVLIPEHNTRVEIWGALFAPTSDKTTDNPLALVMQVPIGQRLDQPIDTEAWPATPINRLARALRRHGIEIGVVTDGRWFALVWASDDASTASGQFDSLIWNEELLSRDSFISLLELKRFIGVSEEERLPALFSQSLLQQEEITEALGKQVRQAVELLVQSFSEIRIEELAKANPDPMPAMQREPYEAAVNVMMRLVFMLFAEERGLLPVDNELYVSSYALTGQLQKLQEFELIAPERLEDFDVWHRIFATSEAIYSGASFEDIRMPAYGGSLFDPEKYPWLTLRSSDGSLTIKVNDRTMLEVLRSIQSVREGNQSRQISFREVDVEQIGYIYEGLLGYTSKYVSDDIVVGLIGKAGDEPEIKFSQLSSLRNANSKDSDFYEKLKEYLDQEQPAAILPSKRAFERALESEPNDLAESELLKVLSHNTESVKSLLPLFNIIRKDLRGLPYIVSKNGIVVTETKSRRHAGAHYTPRFLAEEVVTHALEPLVYEPGPLDEEDPSNWHLKSSAEILNLKVADIAVGSGAFLVAAARFLAERLVEAWKLEGAAQEPNIDSHEVGDELQTLAIREVIARCLYGADINEMAVEMCKLSLWLVSLDQNKPFTFLNDKILVGNALLGLTDLEQLKKVHIFPDAVGSQLEFMDIQSDIDEAIRLRREIAATQIDNTDIHRSANHKQVLLDKSKEVTQKFRKYADAIVAAGLELGGKPGNKLNTVYDNLRLEIEHIQGPGNDADWSVVDWIIEKGLTPTVETDYERWKPLHWILEVPDVMETGGFDAIVGNPPFLNSNSIASSVGSNLREWLANVVAQMPGRADFVAYFFRRSATLVKWNGTFGLIGSRAVSEGSSVRIGIQPLVVAAWTIFRAYTNRPWPTRNVGTNISIVWAKNGEISINAILDGMSVSQISGIMTDVSLGSTEFEDLPKNIFISKGSGFLGEGFVIDKGTRDKFVSENPHEEEVIFELISGQILNSMRTSPKYIIDFREMKEFEAKRYFNCYQQVELYVKPERMKKDVRRYPRMVNEWWKHWNSRPELYDKLSTITFCIAIAELSSHLIPLKVDTGKVFSSTCYIWPTNDEAFFALLSSWFHRFWSIELGTTMSGVSFRYTSESCFGTFPLSSRSDKLENLGKQLSAVQHTLAKERDIGITEIYNMVNSTEAVDTDIQELRILHREIDQEVAHLYGFEIEFDDYVVAPTKGVMQYGPTPEQRDEIRLLMQAENRRQAKEGVRLWPKP